MTPVLKFVATWGLLGLVLLVVGLLAHAWEPIIGHAIASLVLGWPIISLLSELNQ